VEGTFESEKYKYTGYWKKGMKDGFGELTRKSGFRYVGDWANDRKHGHGVAYWPDGSHYGNSIPSSLTFSSLF
jgi:hypothetical protein